MKVLLGIQARTNSTRFPNKIYQQLGDKTVLEHVYEKCSSVSIYKNVLDIDTRILPPANDTELEEFCHKKQLSYIQCDSDIKEDDLVARYDSAIDAMGSDFMIRITADCPLLETGWVSQAIISLMDNDYVSNTLTRTCIDGHDVQGITKAAWGYYVNMAEDKEHVFRDIEQDYKFREKFISEGYKVQSLCSSDKTIVNPYHPQTKLSLDTKEDFERIKGVYEQLQRKS